MCDNKKEIRKHLKAQRRDFASKGCIREMSERIWDRLDSCPPMSEAGTVLAYCSMPDEVSTEGFFRRYLGRKRIAVPLVCGETLTLKEYDPGKTHKGYMDIEEPDEDADVITAKEIDFAIIPGVAFDNRCMRLGRGGGFYDRLLPLLKCQKAGVAFDFQIIESVPADPWDRPVDLVVTPDGIISGQG